MLTQDFHQRHRGNLPAWWTDLGPAATPELFNRLTSVINFTELAAPTEFSIYRRYARFLGNKWQHLGAREDGA